MAKIIIKVMYYMEVSDTLKETELMSVIKDTLEVGGGEVLDVIAIDKVNRIPGPYSRFG